MRISSCLLELQFNIVVSLDVNCIRFVRKIAFIVRTPDDSNEFRNEPIWLGKAEAISCTASAIGWVLVFKRG